jgi:hypothetical protein
MAAAGTVVVREGGLADRWAEALWPIPSAVDAGRFGEREQGGAILRQRESSFDRGIGGGFVALEVCGA